MNINANALNSTIVTDPGRSTGLADRQTAYMDNQGPLVRDNAIGSSRPGVINGMVVRGETLTTQSVWDDTDIVHVLLNEVYVPDFHTYGGLRLESSQHESLVIKVLGANAGFSANGQPLDIIDRIGGIIQIIGGGVAPVVITSLRDDSVGAGKDLQGYLLTDTNGDGTATLPAPGDWRSISIEEFAHDRNVAVYIESEVADAVSADVNAVVEASEYVGTLALDEYAGDENLRLGFEIQGTIDNPGDIDVYRFSAVAGTQVWLDIDRSTMALDSVVELLDGNGQILALSDNTRDEELGFWSVVANGAQAFTLDYSPFNSDDLYTLNARDAGMRVVLPGTVGVRSDYFVRVRSSNIDSTNGAANRADLTDPSKIGNGLTQGAYQLQIRLQELDEIPGTTILHADIRYATTGIEITGQPVHSPLAGEFEEIENNNNFGNANNPLGNLMTTDRGALSVRGEISAPNDIDFYQFEVNYVETQTIGGVSLVGPHVPVTFDLDYSDGIARGDLTLAVYDASGRLILISQDSNIAEDQPGPNAGLDGTDLTRGTIGKFDPYIGTVELPGGVYWLAVSSSPRIPQGMDQFFSANSQQPLLRVEPINSVQRIAEERFTNNDNDSFTTAVQPTTNLFDVGSGALDAKHIVDYSLPDVVLFVSGSNGVANTGATFFTVNPFTGSNDTVLGGITQTIGDIAMRPDGQLYTFTTSSSTTAQSTSGVTGNYLRIHTGTGAATNLGDDGLVTNRDNLDSNNLLTPGDNNVTTANAGMLYAAMAFSGTGTEDLWAVGRRASVTEPASSTNVAAYNDNILYQFNSTNGGVVGNGNNRTNDARAYNGAGTTQREIGQLNVTGTVTGMALMGGQMFYVTTTGELYRGAVGSANVTLRGNVGNLSINFAGLAAGPDEVEGGAFAQTLFGISANGEIFAFDSTGTLKPVFVDGQTSVNTGLNSINGLAFSTLDRNLWGLTTNLRNNDAGHGIDARFDDSLTAQAGGNSLYFGNQRNGANAGNQNNLATGAINDVNFPGGAHGSIISNSFSLAGYNKSDKPTLYFNYFLETEDAAYAPGGARMRDAFRVFVADESGNWNLLSTNDAFQSSAQSDEYDFGPNGGASSVPTGQNFPDVVETFDNTNSWRQARIDLSNYAGLDNLRLRFDFSTAGAMDVGNINTMGSELRALPGASLRDGQTFVIDGVTFEFEMGATLITPSGSAADGQSFTAGGQTFNYVTAGGGPATDIVILLSDTPAQVAQKTRTRVNAVLGAGNALISPNTPNRVVLPGNNITGAGAALTVDGGVGVPGANRPVVISPLMTQDEVAVVIRQALADEFSAGDITNIKGSEDLVRVIGHTVTNAGPLGFDDALPGDTFGAYHTGTLTAPGSVRGSNNDVEGVYLDDIIIGFAERGEMVVNSAVNTNYMDNEWVTNPNYAGTWPGIDVGEYDVEIRRASDYAKTQDSAPTNGLYKAIDTNDRETQSTSITLPNASEIPDGSVLAISDGVNTVRFQFIDVDGTTIAQSGFYPIPFDAATGAAGSHNAESGFVLAARIRNAINSAGVQSLLKIRATTSDSVNTGNGSTSATLHLIGNALVTPDANLPVTTTQFNAFGDQNHKRDQGQLIISDSLISNSLNFAVSVDADPRGAGANPELPHPGSVRNLLEINNSRLVTGVVISNNVIARNGSGIHFSGDSVLNPAGQVPYGRIINNTIVGIGSGTGILVDQSAGPTILNNILADFATGINVDASSRTAGTTLGANLFRNAPTTAQNQGTFSIVLQPGDPLFVDQTTGNYYLAPLSKAIDSALDSLGDRTGLITVKNPLGIGISPVLAPDYDVYGQLRGDDPAVATPNGQGGNVFTDRGAIDRVDFFQPYGELSIPEDQSTLDLDPAVDIVWINEPTPIREFRIRLVDEGIGIDDANVNTSQFRLFQDGTQLTDGVDYVFSYNQITKEAVFAAVTFFPFETRYLIEVDNSDDTTDGVTGVRDRAGNFLLPNQTDGTAQFRILVTDGVNDPPINAVPPGQVVDEDTNLVFSSANGNQISVSDADVHLGNNRLLVTLTAVNGQLTLATTNNLVFTNGTGTGDVTMTFEGDVADLNIALNGLIFRPDQDYFGPASLTITTDDQGQLTGPPSLPESDTDTIDITVNPVNDKPTFNLGSDPAAIDEDAGAQTVAGFLTNPAAGPANETPP
ncbi:MAG: hypothetical protein KDA96_04990 [Planctomycetaceae bacterium]|nr:hypothetical protein [Planctomycetaceae bacterium]